MLTIFLPPQVQVVTTCLYRVPYPSTVSLVGQRMDTDPSWPILSCPLSEDETVMFKLGAAGNNL